MKIKVSSLYTSGTSLGHKKSVTLFRFMVSFAGVQRKPPAGQNPEVYSVMRTESFSMNNLYLYRTSVYTELMLHPRHRIISEYRIKDMIRKQCVFMNYCLVY